VDVSIAGKFLMSAAAGLAHTKDRSFGLSGKVVDVWIWLGCVVVIHQPLHRLRSASVTITKPHGIQRCGQHLHKQMNDIVIIIGQPRLYRHVEIAAGS
jgi:hypothetical protein